MDTHHGPVEGLDADTVAFGVEVIRPKGFRRCSTSSPRCQRHRDGMYRPVFDADVDALHALCRRWIEQSYLLKRKQEQKATVKAPAAPQSGEATAMSAEKAMSAGKKP